MISEAYINRTVKEIFEEIEFPAAPAGLYDPLRYMISIGGKRIRPKLCILTYSIFKDDLYNEIIEPALALEVFHSFTLIHDDIMDRSPLRRGMPTVWKKWNEDTAILSGDVMNIDSYRRIAMTPERVRGKVAHGDAHEHGFVLEIIDLDRLDDDRHLRTDAHRDQKQNKDRRENMAQLEKHGSIPFRKKFERRLRDRLRINGCVTS